MDTLRYVQADVIQASACTLLLKMKIWLMNINHILSFHILSQQKFNQFDYLSKLGLDVPM
jgi:hypothetical protein